MVVYDPTTLPASKYRTLPILKADLLRLARLAELGPERLLTLQVSISPSALQPRSDPLCLDIETVGHSTAIERIGVSHGSEVWTAPWNGAVARRTQELIDATSLLVGHNLAFDIARLRRAGISIPREKPLFDTMLASHLIQPDFYKGLGRIAPLYLDLHRWKFMSDTNPAFYNASDVAITHAIFQTELNCLKHYGISQLFEEVVMPNLPVLIDMTARGLAVDPIYLNEWRSTLLDRTTRLQSELRTLAPGVSPNSNPQLQEFIYGSRHGSVDEASLKAIAARGFGVADPLRQHYINLLLQFREHHKLLSTYTTLPIEDGFVHPSFLPLDKDSPRGTAATGRLASTHPNIQNQPQSARRLFIPRHPSWLMWEFDYSQIELRIAAALSNDRVLLRALSGDVHAVTMAALGCDRTRAKNVTYGTLYGAGPGTISKLLTTQGFPTTMPQARALQQRFFSLYRDLSDWRYQVAREGATQKFLRNGFGRLRWFHSCYISDAGEVEGAEIPEMFDYLPQSTAADIMWSGLGPVDAAVTSCGGLLLAQIHDSFLCELPPGTKPQAIIDAMEREFPQVAPGFRVPVSSKFGPSWGEMRDAQQV